MNDKKILRMTGAGETLMLSLPVKMCRMMKLQKGTVLDVNQIGNQIILTPIAGLAETAQ